MIASCKKTFYNFKKNENYKIDGIHSIFEKDDFITLIDNQVTARFRLNKSTDYIDDYIGSDEYYFYDYFTILKEERKQKLKKIDKSKI
jgi:hypothetical protein